MITKIAILIAIGIVSFIFGFFLGRRDAKKELQEVWAGVVIFDDDDVYASFSSGSLHGLREGDTVKLGVHYK